MTGEDIVWHAATLDRAHRWEIQGHEGLVVWFTGFSGSGKSTVAAEVEHRLVTSERPAVVLDGDNLRHGLTSDLGFSEADRRENIRRVSEVAVLFADAGLVALVPVISPYRSDRAAARERAARAGLRFVEVFLDTSLEECERRDPKGLYAKARSGELVGFTGIDAPYEPPDDPEVRLTPSAGDVASQSDVVIAALG